MTTREQMLEAITSAGDDPATVVCFYQRITGERWHEELSAPIRCTVEQLPERDFDEGYGSMEGEPVIGFSPSHVYVKTTYDGSEWISAVPRNPENVTDGLPALGGG